MSIFVAIGQTFAEIRQFFLILKMTVVRHLRFSKVPDFNGPWVSRAKVRQLANFMITSHNRATRDFGSIWAIRLPARPSAKSAQSCLYPPARLSVVVSHAAARAVYSDPQAVCARRLPPVPAATDRPSLHVSHARGVTSGLSDY